MSFVRDFIHWNMRLSDSLDKYLPAQVSIDGNSDFNKNFAPRYLRRRARVIDVGGGKRPFVSVEIKRELELVVIGIDISRDELEKAPAGVYDELIAHDIESFKGSGDADVVLCQAVLEHVRDTEGAFRAIASCLSPVELRVYLCHHVTPSSARLNIALPQRWKERLLFSIFPKTRSTQGFPKFMPTARLLVSLN